MGVAIISIPFGVVGLYLGDDLMVMINEISLAVNSSIILSNLIGLKIMADELVISVRVFAIGAWIVDIFLIGLALVDVYSYVTFSWLSVLEYFFRIVEIFVYTVIAVQCIQLWNLYEYRPSNYSKDVCFAILLVILFLVVVVGFVAAIYIAEEKAWRVMYW